MTELQKDAAWLRKLATMIGPLNDMRGPERLRAIADRIEAALIAGEAEAPAPRPIAPLTHCAVCDLTWSGPWTDCPGCQAIAGMQALAGDAIPNAVAVELAGQANDLQAQIVALNKSLDGYLALVGQQNEQIAALTAERDAVRSALMQADAACIQTEGQVQALTTQLAEQRAELSGMLSETFQAIPACYDTPADHYREMARRLVEDRDVQKHKARNAEACVLELTEKLRKYEESAVS